MKKNKFFWSIVTPFWFLACIFVLISVFVVKKLKINYFREFSDKTFKEDMKNDLNIGIDNLRNYWKSSTWF